MNKKVLVVLINELNNSIKLNEKTYSDILTFLILISLVYILADVDLILLPRKSILKLN